MRRRLLPPLALLLALLLATPAALGQTLQTAGGCTDSCVFTTFVKITGASGAGPDLEVALTGDTVSRVAVGLNTSDVARISFGPGGASNRDLFLERAAAANLRLGGPAAASAVAQTISVQNVVTGTSNVAGANLIIAGSQSTGNANGGNIVFQTALAGGSGTAQNALSTIMTLDGLGIVTLNQQVLRGSTSLSLQSTGGNNVLVQTNGGSYTAAAFQPSGLPNIALGGTTSSFPGFQRSGTTVQVKLADGSADTALTTGAFTASAAAVLLTGIASDAAATDTTLCLKSADGTVLKGSGTLGICLGTSSMRFKRDIVEERDGLAQIAALKPVNFRYLPGHVDDGAREQYGFLAEDVVAVLPKLVGLDRDGLPNSVDILGMVPILVRAMQQQQAEISELKAHKETSP